MISSAQHRWPDLRHYTYYFVSVRRSLYGGRKYTRAKDRDILIKFYQINPALWNHRMIEYRDRNIRRALIQKLREEFAQKSTENGIKKSRMFF